MKAKQKTLTLLLAALAVLAAALALAVWCSNRAAASEAENHIQLSTLDGDALERIEYSCGDESVALIRQDGQWVLESDPAYHISQTRAQTMADTLCSLAANRALGDTDTAAYGLDSPRQTVTAVADGQNWSVCFGDENELTGDVYLRVEGDSAVYTADASVQDPFAYTAQQLFEAFSPVGLSTGEITAIEYTRTDGETPQTVRLRKVSRLAQSEETDSEADSDADSGEESEAVYETVWLLADDTQASTSLVTVMLSQITSNVSGQITSPEAASVYGLETPAVTVALTDSEGAVHTVRLGTGADGCYLAVEGDDSVYQTDLETLDAFAHTAAELAAQDTAE